ncbi:MAG: glycosyltransferase family A protein [Alphaproteobacteria bacterium]
MTFAVLTYNAEATLERTLESLLAQTHANLEILIQDDGSSDGTRDIAARYAASDPRVRNMNTPHNLGGWGNYALATERASGQFITWCCPGDTYASGFTGALVQRLQDTPSAVAAASPPVFHDWDAGEDVYTADFTGARNPENFSGLRLAKRILIKERGRNKSRAPYGNFIHGLIDRDKLLGVFSALKDTGPILNDRILSCHLALAGPFVVTQESLFQREYHRQPAHLRNPNEANLQISSGKLFSFYVQAARQILLSFVRSPILNTRQKWMVAPLLASYLGTEAGSAVFRNIVPAMRRLLPESAYRVLRDFYQRSPTK